MKINKHNGTFINTFKDHFSYESYIFILKNCSYNGLCNIILSTLLKKNISIIKEDLYTLKYFHNKNKNTDNIVPMLCYCTKFNINLDIHLQNYLELNPNYFIRLIEQLIKSDTIYNIPKLNYYLEYYFTTCKTIIIFCHLIRFCDKYNLINHFCQQIVNFLNYIFVFDNYKARNSKYSSYITFDKILDSVGSLKEFYQIFSSKKINKQNLEYKIRKDFNGFQNENIKYYIILINLLELDISLFHTTI